MCVFTCVCARKHVQAIVHAPANYQINPLACAGVLYAHACVFQCMCVCFRLNAHLLFKIGKSSVPFVFFLVFVIVHVHMHIERVCARVCTCVYTYVL